MFLHPYYEYCIVIRALGQSGEGTAGFLGFASSSPSADVLLHEGDSVRFGENVLKVLHTPGHSRGGITLIGKKEVFTGDACALFAGSIGRTDSPGSSATDMSRSLDKLVHLPDDFIVYPGHGPATTTREGRRNNPSFQWV